MTTVWLLNSIGLFLTTVGALLTFLYLRESPRFAEDFKTPEMRRAYERHQSLIKLAVGLLAAWFVIQYLAVILL